MAAKLLTGPSINCSLYCRSLIFASRISSRVPNKAGDIHLLRCMLGCLYMRFEETCMPIFLPYNFLISLLTVDLYIAAKEDYSYCLYSLCRMMLQGLENGGWYVRF